MTTTHAPPNLNHAAAGLIEALDGIRDMAGFRLGVRNAIAYWGHLARPGNPSHRDALELIEAWKALDALAAAVQNRRERNHG